MISDLLLELIRELIACVEKLLPNVLLSRGSHNVGVRPGSHEIFGPAVVSGASPTLCSYRSMDTVLYKESQPHIPALVV